MSDAATEPAPDLQGEPDGPTLATMLATGATYRKLDYWTRLGILSPRGSRRPGSGYNRRWTDRDLELVRLILPLTVAGLDLALAVRLARLAVDDGQHEATLDTPHGTVTLRWDTTTGATP